MSEAPTVLPPLPTTSMWSNARPGEGLPAVRVYVPARPGEGRPWMLLLHGWNQHAIDWEHQTTVEAIAERDGVVLVAPDVGRTVYLGQRYPETPVTAVDEPGLPHVTQIVSWAETTLGLAAAPSKRAVVGVSTGGRGAALLGVRGDFGTVVALSGTYDLAALAAGTGEYRIHAAVLGPRSTYPGRWSNEDVAHARTTAERLPAARWFLGHAAADPYVPSAQTPAFERSLRSRGVDDVRVRIDPGAHHDWVTWNRWLQEALLPAGG